MICSQCEYEKSCFPPLKLLQKVTGSICKQGRKKKEYRVRQSTLPITDQGKV
jgi:hypothetical protein